MTVAQLRPVRARAHIVLFLALFSTCVVGCQIITDYDPVSYKNATDLKAECLAMIAKSANGPMSQFDTEVDSLRLKLNQAAEYEKGKGDLNSETAKMWEIMTDPNRKLMGGFFEFWKTKDGALKPALTTEFAGQVTEGFDKIIQLENAKRKRG